MSLYDNSFNNQPIIIDISSDNRLSGSNESFTSNPQDIDIGMCDTVVLISAGFYKSYFNIPVLYNQFILKENSTQVVISLPTGTYNKNNFLTNLQTLLNNNSPNGLLYTVSYPSITQPDTYRYTFTSNSASIISSFIFSSSSPYLQMGFTQGTFQFTSAITTSSLTSLNAINLQYISDLQITSNICNNNSNVLATVTGLGSYPFQSEIVYICPNIDLCSCELNTAVLNSWNFTIKNSNINQLVSLNGVYWKCKLGIYQRNITHQIHRADLLISREEKKFKIQQEQQALIDQSNNIVSAISDDYVSSQNNFSSNEPLFERTKYEYLPLTDGYVSNIFSNDTDKIHLPK